jgi:flagellar hook-length control protein FliK
MNIAPSTQSLGGPAGAQAKPGKSGDPLADFMALLSQLGIAIEGDGATAPATAEGQDAAAKLLAKLAKKIKGADGEAIPEAGAKEEGAKKDESVTTLADLLANLNPAAGTEPAKLDIAALMAAVRAFATNTVAKAPEGDTATTDGEAIQAAPAMTSSIAALLARVTQATGKPAAPADASSADSPEAGTGQSAFARLETLVSAKPSTSQNDGTENGASTTDDGKARPTPKTSAAQLSELIARLTDSPKPATASAPQAAAPAAATINAAIAQAVRHAGRDDQTAADPTSLNAPTLGVAPAAPSVSANGINAAQGPAAPTPADEMINHHLDLAKDSEWLDTLARDITRAAQSDAKLRFDLNPEHLGSLKVELLNGTNGTSVKMTTETEAARAILADAQPRLVAEARAQGLRISEAHVNLGGQGGGHRPAPETPVVIRTAAGGGSLGEVELERPAASGERYA